MTVSDSIIKWLEKFTKAKISTDKLGESSISFGLFKTPQQTKVSDIIGNSKFNDFYTYAVRLDNLTDANMKKNQEYMQSLTDWITAQNKGKKFPELTDAECLSIEVSTPFYAGVAEERSAIYQLTINIQYVK